MDRAVRLVGVLLFLWVCQTVALVLGSPATIPLFGDIRSPNYPKEYPASNRTEWELAVPKGFLLKLRFKYFDVEPSVDCLYDHVECDGEVFREEQGVISSPLYPNAYPPTLSCRYQLRLERGFLVTLHFTGLFQVDHYKEKECPYDTLQIVIPGKDPQTYCGNKSPGTIETESHSVDIIFRTDESGYSKGWRIKYSSKRVKCPMPVQFPNGKITPVFEEYRYRDYIKVRCNVGYKMMSHGHEITDFLSVCQNDGTWHLPLPQCHIVDCGVPLSLLNGRIEYSVGRESENVYQSVIKYHCNEPYYKIVLLVSAGRAGAFLITDQWIMTAAHNIYPKHKEQGDSLQDLAQSIEIHLGDTNVENLTYMPRLEIEGIFVHPGFQTGALQFNNDIALIKLRHRVTVNETVMPLCLPAAGSLYQPDVMGYVSGWGITEGYKLSNQLKYVALPVVDLRQCNNSIQSQKNSHKMAGIPQLTDNMFCAGRVEGGEDTCSGDSGGAFTLLREVEGGAEEFYAAGIVSWGVDCGKKGNYGVYTRVERYLSWIRQTIQGN
ncbi:UNVERIFIED_CONTAM: hypothetical protein FKN15_025648 [Acipenser sinensis]